MSEAPGAEVWATSRQSSLRMVAYDAAGPGGPSVVALHGLVVGIDVLRESSPARPGVAPPDPYQRLADHGFNVLALDWPGHGRSGGRRGHLTYRLAMDAAATAMDTAQQRWDGPVGLFGMGLGGALAFYAALEDDRAEAVACHCLCDLRAVGPLLRRLRQRVVSPLAARLAARLSFEAQASVPMPVRAIVAPSDFADAPELARRLLRHPQAVRTYDLSALASLLLTPHDKPDVGAQRTPTLVAVGSGDLVIPETAARGVVSRLSCPHELFVLPGAGHQLALEHPRALFPEVARFLHTHLRP